MYAKIVRVSISEDSNATSVFRGSGSPGWPVLRCSVLMNLDSLFKFGIAQRQKRLALQISGKDGKPNSGQGQNRDDAPASVEPSAIEADFLRQIAGPDNEELGETEISPEHDESEQELAKIVQVAVLDHALHRRGAREQDKHGDHQRHRGDQLSNYEEETVDRRSPVGRKRHDPVNGSERHDKDVEDDAGTRHHFHPPAKRAVFPVQVLFFRPAVEDVNQSQPNEEVVESARFETEYSVGDQIALLEIGKPSLSRGRRVEPFSVKVLHAENDYGQE